MTTNSEFRRFPAASPSLRSSSLLVGVAAVVVAGGLCGAASPPASTRQAPAGAGSERALPSQLRPEQVVSAVGMVATGNAGASWAGARMLQDGGNAVDAAVAAAFALGVVEPGSSGIGGQTYVVIRMSDGFAVAIDGSVHAPLRSSVGTLALMQDDTSRIRPGTAFWGYEAVATPGTLAALDLALRSFGTKSLAEVVQPAIELAEFGSRWTPAQRSFLVDYTTKVRASAYLSALFLNGALDVWGEDHVYCNPDLACFLRRLAHVGVADFYHGAIAGEIATDMEQHKGWLRRADLELMEATATPPVRGRYRGIEVLSMPFPGGGSTVVEALSILDRFTPAVLREDSVDRLHLLVEACRLAVADGFPVRRPSRLPDDLAADPAHVARRAAMIRFDRALTPAEVSPLPLSLVEAGGTTQVSTVDARGNAVSLTQTLGATFGAGVASAGMGFSYNGLMNSYDFKDQTAWAFLRPLQPPITSMAPTILVKDGRPFLVLGSAGTARIAPVIVNVVSAVVDRALPACEAVAMPRVLWGGNSDRQVYLEMADPITDRSADELAGRGFADQERLRFPTTPYLLTDFGAANVVFVDPADGTMVGVGDPRRQGAAEAAGDTRAPSPPVSLPPCWRSLRSAGSR